MGLAILGFCAVLADVYRRTKTLSSVTYYRNTQLKQAIKLVINPVNTEEQAAESQAPSQCAVFIFLTLSQHKLFVCTKMVLWILIFTTCLPYSLPALILVKRKIYKTKHYHSCKTWDLTFALGAAGFLAACFAFLASLAALRGNRETISQTKQAAEIDMDKTLSHLVLSYVTKISGGEKDNWERVNG